MMECYSAIKKNEIMLIATTRMDLEIVTPSELSRTQKDKCLMLSLICGIFLMITNKPIYKTEIDSQTQKTNVWLSKWKGGRDKLGIQS